MGGLGLSQLNLWLIIVAVMLIPLALAISDNSTNYSITGDVVGGGSNFTATSSAGEAFVTTNAGTNFTVTEYSGYVGYFTNAVTSFSTTFDLSLPTVSNATINVSDRIVRSSENITVSVNVTDNLQVVQVNVTNATGRGFNMTQTGISPVWELNTTAASLGCTATDGNCTFMFNATDNYGNLNNTHLLGVIIDDIIPVMNSVVFSSNSTYLYVQINQSNFSRASFTSLDC